MGQEAKVKAVRSRARAAGMPEKPFEVILKAYGPDAAEFAIEQWEKKHAVKSKSLVTIDVTPTQLEDMAVQAGIDVKGGLWTVLTRENTTDRLYELLTRAGASLEATKELRAKQFWGTAPPAATPHRDAFTGLSIEG